MCGNYQNIEIKYKEIIDIAINYMNSISDYEHDINHMLDVVLYTKKLLNILKIDVDYDVCIISAYWHDVGRIKLNVGHEKLSADMLKDELEKRGYNKVFIEKCYKAIEYHRWDMKPVTKEGLVVKDADKLAFIGMGRWKSCLKNGQRLDEIVKLLPKLRNEFLHFDESKSIFDNDICLLINLLYDNFVGEV